MRHIALLAACLLTLAACGGTDTVAETEAFVDDWIVAWNAGDTGYFEDFWTDDIEWSNRNGLSASGAAEIEALDLLQYMGPPKQHTFTRVSDGTLTEAETVLFDVDYEVNGELMPVIWEVKVEDGRVSVHHETRRSG